jgi:hypothetical protein
MSKPATLPPNSNRSQPNLLLDPTHLGEELAVQLSCALPHQRRPDLEAVLRGLDLRFLTEDAFERRLLRA